MSRPAASSYFGTLFTRKAQTAARPRTLAPARIATPARAVRSSVPEIITAEPPRPQTPTAPIPTIVRAPEPSMPPALSQPRTAAIPPPTPTPPRVPTPTATVHTAAPNSKQPVPPTAPAPERFVVQEVFIETVAPPAPEPIAPRAALPSEPPAVEAVRTLPPPPIPEAPRRHLETVIDWPPQLNAEQRNTVRNEVERHARESLAAIAPPRREPGPQKVEVRVDQVNIRFTAPETPRATAASAPESSFGEFFRVRSLR
jgi:hypothetical protein